MTPSSAAVRTVRDATFDVLRQYKLTRMFANPGSTEISLLANLPADLDFTLALHEGSVVGIATGYALARHEPALVIVHTTAGLGNAVGAIATARVNRAPLVIIIGQQDRRHLATDPFLAGKLRGLVGDYPVWFNEPATSQDVPAAVARAFHEAKSHRGPALVVVPMDCWLEPYDSARPFTAPEHVVVAGNPDTASIAALAEKIDAAQNPVIISGAGNSTKTGWSAAVRLAEKLTVPVYQESFAGGAGFPQDHPLFAGFLSSSKATVREQLAPHDLILSIGAPVFRQYNYEPGEWFGPDTTVLLITADADEAHRSPVQLAVIADIAETTEALADRVKAVNSARQAVPARRPAPAPPTAGEPLRASHVIAALAQRLPEDTILVEETPSTRPDLHELLPARTPMGFISAAMGGLGFGLPAAIGLRMGAPKTPTVAILGDGSALYAIQGLWSAAHYKVGSLFIILNNGRYAVMDRLAEKFGGSPPAWPAFDEINFTELSNSFGCDAQRISSFTQLTDALDVIVPGLADRTTPLVLVIDVEPELHFAP